MTVYSFDGRDAVIDESKQIVYDGLPGRSGELVADLLNDNEYERAMADMWKQRAIQLGWGDTPEAKEVEQNRQEGLALISKAFQDAMNAEVTR